MRSVKIALAVGFGITAIAVALVLSKPPQAVLATNSVSEGEELAVTTKKGAHVCQSGERLPRGTRAIRLGIDAFTGPRVTVEVLSGKHVVTSGERTSIWSGQTVAVPVKAVSHTVSPVTVCFSTARIAEALTIFGNRTGQALAARTGEGKVLAGRVGIAYLGKGRSSWLALASSVAQHMGFARAWGGSWIAVLVVVLMLAATGLASRLVLREAHE